MSIRSTIAATSMLLASFLLAATVHADVISSYGDEAPQAVTTIQAQPDRDSLVDALVERGLEPQAARDRVAAMTAGETAELANNIDTLPAGAALSTTELLLIIILIVLLV